MGNLTYTIATSEDRRLWYRSADVATIAARSNSSAAWQTVYDGQIKPKADTYVSQTDAQVVLSGSVVDEDLWKRFLTLAVVGDIEGGGYHAKLKSCALLAAQSTWPGFTKKRYINLGQATAYDCLRSSASTTFSDANKKTIGDRLIAEGGFTGSTSEYMDGHSAGNLMSQLAAGIALAGESGSGFNYTTSAATLVSNAIDFWFGTGPGQPKRIDADRYLNSDGGSYTGTWYGVLRHWFSLTTLMLIHNGFVRNADTANALQEAGSDYEPWTSETWVGKVGEWYINAWCRGDDDYHSLHDTPRTTNPFFNEEPRQVLGQLITYGGAWRKQCRWLYDRLQAKDVELNGTVSGEKRVWDLMWWNPADLANVSQSPTAAATPKTRLFSVPGILFHRNSWDPTNKTEGFVVCNTYTYEGHTHFENGSLRIVVNGDPVVFRNGFYSTGDTNADYGGLHHAYYYQQSIAQSGIILCDDGSALPHKVKVGGSRTAIPSGLGGQYRRQFVRSGTTVYDPRSIDDLRFEGSGLAWKLTGKDATSLDDFELRQQTTSFDYACCDLRRSYLLFATDYGTSAERMTLYDYQVMIIKDVWTHPIWFIVHHFKPKQASYICRQPWHFWNQPVVNNFNGNMIRATALGNKGIGRAVIDIYNGAETFTSDIVGTNSLGGNGIYTDQFAYKTGGTNYPPSNGPTWRNAPEMGKYTLHYRAQSQSTEHYFVNVVSPCLAAQLPPSYVLVEDPDYFILSFSGGKEYQLPKQGFLSSSNPPPTGDDTTPPGAPTGVTATTGSLTGSINVSWDPNPETDIDSYQVYYREKV